MCAGRSWRWEALRCGTSQYRTGAGPRRSSLKHDRRSPDDRRRGGPGPHTRLDIEDLLVVVDHVSPRKFVPGRRQPRQSQQEARLAASWQAFISRAVRQEGSESPPAHRVVQILQKDRHDACNSTLTRRSSWSRAFDQTGSLIRQREPDTRRGMLMRRKRAYEALREAVRDFFDQVVLRGRFQSLAAHQRLGGICVRALGEEVHGRRVAARECVAVLGGLPAHRTVRAARRCVGSAECAQADSPLRPIACSGAGT